MLVEDESSSNYTGSNHTLLINVKRDDGHEVEAEQFGTTINNYSTINCRHSCMLVVADDMKVGVKRDSLVQEA